MTAPLSPLLDLERRALALLGVTEAAAQLGVSVRELRRWLAAGAPQAVRGRRGRSGRARIDVQAVAAWRASMRGEAVHAPHTLQLVAADVPEILALAIGRVFRSVEGPHKRAVAAVLAGAWYECATAMRDRIARDVPDVPEINAVPPEIGRLRHI